MSYTITAVQQFGPNHIKVSYNLDDGRPDEEEVFALADLRDRVVALPFRQAIRVWLAQQYEAGALDPKALAATALKTSAEGKKLRVAATQEKARADDAALPADVPAGDRPGKEP